jgi:hypothetical protein
VPRVAGAVGLRLELDVGAVVRLGVGAVADVRVLRRGEGRQENPALHRLDEPAGKRRAARVARRCTGAEARGETGETLHVTATRVLWGTRPFERRAAGIRTGAGRQTYLT